jgi:ubiquinone/menaquinone biosynthesis C-methylase UbiE
MAATQIDAIAYHGQLADGWEQRNCKPSFRSRETVLLECIGGCNLTGSQWLDAGCGTGTFSRWLAMRGCAVLGVDASPEMLRCAQRSSEAMSFRGPLHFEQIGTIASLPLQDSVLDGVLCSSVLEYVTDPARCLEQFARVLKPGGVLLVSVPNRQSIFRKIQHIHYCAGKRWGRASWSEFMTHSHHEYRVRQFKQELASQGLVTERVLAFGSPLPKWVQRRFWGGSLLMFMARKRTEITDI